MSSFAPFSVAVPATTANLGPGFDCLGMALDLWNRVRVAPGEATEVRVTGEGAEVLPSDGRNLVYRAVVRLFRHLGRAAPSLHLEACNAVPLARGLGSSAAATVAGLVIADRLAGEPLDRGELLALAAEMEGHPDNAAPALWGGCCLVVRHAEDYLVRSVPLPEGLACVLFIPQMTLSTRAARAVLPRRVPREDAIFNVGRTALLVRALALGEWADLRLATEDRLHQPYRATLFPALTPLIRAALEAGAAGAFLSGAGSTVLAFAQAEAAAAVAAAFEAVAQAQGVPGAARVVRPATEGARVIAEHA
ncbi:MAG: homoserine kinase [Chloroflexi bacterium]|nr:homoserine kinase [Chloroflexota bacterium]